MPIFDNASNFPISTWTTDDVVVLEAIDDYFIPGLIKFLGFVISSEGLISASIDLILVIQSVVNGSDERYSFDDAERIVTIASEFCLVDCVYDAQVLCMVELQDNSVLFLATQGEDNYALEAAVCLSVCEDSMLFDSAIRPSLSLFGHWEYIASSVLDALLTQKKLCDSIGSLMDKVVSTGLSVASEIEFVDVIRKLCAVGLLDVTMGDDDKALVGIEPKPAGLFLLFSGRTDMARTLADISI